MSAGTKYFKKKFCLMMKSFPCTVYKTHKQLCKATDIYGPIDL